MTDKTKINIKKVNLFLIIYLSVYFVANIIFLTKFPAMHSDESWLSGLTRTMMHEGLNSTEYFFDLLPRYPHAIKTVFHIMQMPFILIFGYSLFSVRLLSLVFGLLSLVLFNKIIYKLTGSHLFSFIGMLILSLDIQFIYASHFARQEIVITAVILTAVYYVISKKNSWNYKNDIIAGCIIGLSIGIHPNSFLAAVVVGSVYLYFIIFEKKFKLKNLVVFILVTALFAAAFVILSFSFNSNFIEDYLKYGDDIGASTSGIMKLFAFPKYYRKLFNSFSVTYYTPWIKIQLILFAVVFLLGLLSLIFKRNKKKVLLFLLPIIALNLGYLSIGRYSQPGIVLLFPLCYLLIFILINKTGRMKTIGAAALGLLIITSTALQIPSQTNNEYSEYINEITEAVPADTQVLANLNAEYALGCGSLHDYRNLDKLNGTPFEEYIANNQIQYIIYPQEMDFIYENRPVWNVMYGNVYPYYQDMKVFLQDNCQLVHQFHSPYAMRIFMYSQNQKWTVKIYEVTDNDIR